MWWYRFVSSVFGRRGRKVKSLRVIIMFSGIRLVRLVCGGNGVEGIMGGNSEGNLD